MMMVGYPMTDAALDSMYEADLAQDWEEQSKPVEIDFLGTFTELGKVRDGLSEAVDNLAEAAEIAEGHPFADRILSILNELDGVEKDIDKIRGLLMKEVRTA